MLIHEILFQTWRSRNEPDSSLTAGKKNRLLNR
jgi:hypothetical protein